MLASDSTYDLDDNIFHVSCINTFKYCPKTSLSKIIAQNETVIQNGLYAVLLPFVYEFLKGILTTCSIYYLLLVRFCDRICELRVMFRCAFLPYMTTILCLHNKYLIKIKL
jgi:hypothetical protein